MPPTSLKELSHAGTRTCRPLVDVGLRYLAKPGQPAPYSWFPYAALVTLLAAIGYATLLVRRAPSLAERVGSVVADAE